MESRQCIQESTTRERKATAGAKNSPHVNANAPECMDGRVELTADENKGIANVLFVREPIGPEGENVLQLFRKTEQTRHGTLHLSLWARRHAGS